MLPSCQLRNTSVPTPSPHLTVHNAVKRGLAGSLPLLGLGGGWFLGGLDREAGEDAAEALREVPGFFAE